MNKIILGCSNRNNLSALLTGRFVLVQPEVQIIDSEVHANFDYLLNFETDDYNELPADLIPQMGGPRISKVYQAVILKKNGIPTPPTYGDTSNNGAFNQGLLSDIDDDTQLFLKSNLGARGLGQTIVNRNTLEDLTDTVYDSNIKNEDKLMKIEDNYLVGGDKLSREGVHREFLVDTLRNGSYHFNVALNIKEEYRVIGLYGLEPIIIKRTTNRYQWQANSGITQSATYIENSPFRDEFRKISDTLLNYLKTPWLSIDFFITEDGKLGVFEFQMEMGYKYVPKKLLSTNIRRAVNNYINKNFK